MEESLNKSISYIKEFQHEEEGIYQVDKEDGSPMMISSDDLKTAIEVLEWMKIYSKNEDKNN